MAIYPDVNGIRYDYSSVEININGTVVKGIKQVSFKHTLTPGKVRGTSAQVNGRTRGQYEPEAAVTFYKQEADDFVALLGAGYMEISFDVVIHCADVNQPVKTTLIRGCRITSEDEEYEEGTDALMVKLTLDPIAIVKNGINPIRGLNV